MARITPSKHLQKKLYNEGEPMVTVNLNDGLEAVCTI